MVVKNRILIGAVLMLGGAGVSARGAMEEPYEFDVQQNDSTRDLPERSKDDAPCRCPKARVAEHQEELDALQAQLDETQDSLYRVQQANGYAKVDLGVLEQCLADKKDKSQCMGIVRQLRRSLLKARGRVVVYTDSADLTLFLRDVFGLRDEQNPDAEQPGCPVMDNLIREDAQGSIAGSSSTEKSPDA